MRQLRKLLVPLRDASGRVHSEDGRAGRLDEPSCFVHLFSICRLVRICICPYLICVSYVLEAHLTILLIY